MTKNFLLPPLWSPTCTLFSSLYSLLRYRASLLIANPNQRGHHTPKIVQSSIKSSWPTALPILMKLPPYHLLLPSATKLLPYHLDPLLLTILANFPIIFLPLTGKTPYLKTMIKCYALALGVPLFSILPSLRTKLSSTHASHFASKIHPLPTSMSFRIVPVPMIPNNNNSSTSKTLIPPLPPLIAFRL